MGLTKHYISGLLLVWSWKSGSAAYTEKLKIHFSYFVYSTATELVLCTCPTSPCTGIPTTQRMVFRTPTPEDLSTWRNLLEHRVKSAHGIAVTDNQCPPGDISFSSSLVWPQTCVGRQNSSNFYAWDSWDNWTKWRCEESETLWGLWGVLRVFLRFQTVWGINVSQVWRKLLSCLKLLSDWHTVLRLYQPDNKPSTKM